MNAPPLQHRVARMEDLPQIVAIYNATIASREATADLEPVPVESRWDWFSAHRPDTHPLWVIEDRCGIAAWLSFGTFYGRPAYAATAELSVYVRADARRAGLGRYLLARALEAAPGLGLQTLLGFIFGHNGASLALFERFGFERWGSLPGVAQLDGVQRDLVIVGRKIQF
jgi:phosphinothricin acetyltransferase